MSELRHSVEKLAIWWIPTSIATMAFSALYAKEFGDFIDGWESGIEASDILFLGIVGPMLSRVDNLVVAVWLFLECRNSKKGRPYIWALLGLFTGIIGALLYIAVYIYEQVSKSADA